MLGREMVLLLLLTLLVDCLLLGYQLLMVKLLLLHGKLGNAGIFICVLLCLGHLLLLLSYLVLHKQPLVL